MPEFPAGSRITKCRSIPICGRCGSDELYERLDGVKDDRPGWGLSSAGERPLAVEDIDERSASYYEAQMTPGILTGGPLLTEDGVTDVINPRNTGGWAQYGRADEGDGAGRE
jgi:hypothetical protein